MSVRCTAWPRPPTWSEAGPWALGMSFTWRVVGCGSNRGDSGRSLGGCLDVHMGLGKCTCGNHSFYPQWKRLRERRRSSRQVSGSSSQMSCAIRGFAVGDTMYRTESRKEGPVPSWSREAAARWGAGQAAGGKMNTVRPIAVTSTSLGVGGGYRHNWQARYEL